MDIYDFIMEGRLKDDIRLQDGDVILVNPYQTLVQILGKVKRPMCEMKPTETIATLLKYAQVGLPVMLIKKQYVLYVRAVVNIRYSILMKWIIPYFV